MTARLHHPVLWGVLLWLALLLPPLKHGLEARMTAQMLVQIPLLVVVGCLLAPAIPARLRAQITPYNLHGISGLILMTFVGLYWMLPRMLDAAITQQWAAVAKFVSVPLLIGLPFALSWPRMSFIVRGVFLLEFIATWFRLGWIYSISPVRLCNVYLLGDQQRLGQSMIMVGTMILLWLGWKLMWGRFTTLEPGQIGQ